MQTDYQTKHRETINADLLLSNGGVLKSYDKNEYIFKEGGHPHFYYQIVEGKVKMVNEMDDGRDFIQGFFSAGQSFGEPPIFEGSEYPASAMAVQRSVIIRLHIPSFIQMLKDNFEVHWDITRRLAQRIKMKATSLKEISSHPPEHRIMNVLDGFKKEKLLHTACLGKIKIEYTRKQIADMTGLRVETVIRTMRGLQDKKLLAIHKGKVYY
ncbi:MAG: Crp/Fnr family transcriptional regulator [Williamsia sp.]|nr:Crp/Fnr family transcriptional regulator [Williamsia sp.]